MKKGNSMKNVATEVVEDDDVMTGDPSEDIGAPTEDSATEGMSELRARLTDYAATNTPYPFKTAELIADPKRNGRFMERKASDPSVKELAGMIAQEGQLQAGQVTLGTDDKLYVTFGTGRFLAIELLNKSRHEDDQMPFQATVLIEKPADAETHVQSIVRNAMENWGRLDLSVLDKAHVIGMLMLPAPNGAGLKQSEVVTRLGLKKATVSVLAKIDGFPSELKTLIIEDKISAKAAYDLAVSDPKNVLADAKKLVAESGGAKVSASKAAAKRGNTEAGDTVKKQRTAKQILDFIEAESSIANEKLYGKGLQAKLNLFGKFVSGMAEKTFLKNLGAL